MATWDEMVRKALFDRILEDERYTRKRLGYVPTDDAVRQAIEPYVSAAVDVLAYRLDDYESRVWFDLRKDDE